MRLWGKMHDVGDGFRAGKLLRDDSCVGDFCDDEDEGAPVWVVVPKPRLWKQQLLDASGHQGGQRENCQVLIWIHSDSQC